MLRAQESTTSINHPRIETTGAGLVAKVAPGELLPISMKLLNFGSDERVDVKVFYQIANPTGNVVVVAEDTIAVETTASFIKTIQIPVRSPSGRYTAKSSITYQDQLVPATTMFEFIVEPKIGGFYQDELFLYGGFTLAVSVFTGLLGHLWIRRRRATRLEPIDYSDVPSDQRAFFELISDTVLEMRQHMGDAVFEIASRVDGLKIDRTTGRVLEVTRHPSEIMRALVDGYEKTLARK